MNTSRTLLASTVTLSAFVLAGFGLVHLPVQLTRLLEYGVGSLVTLGLIAMAFVGNPRTNTKRPAKPFPQPTRVRISNRQSRMPHRRSIPQAA